MTEIIEIREDEVNWAIGKLLHEAAVLLGIERSSDAAVDYITDPQSWTVEETPATARRAADKSVARTYRVVLATARSYQGFADVMREQLVAMGYVLEAENADLLDRVNAKLDEIDPKAGIPTGSGKEAGPPPGGGSGPGKGVGNPHRPAPRRGV